MDPKKEVSMEEYVDQRRWLLNNGFITDDVKNQLFFAGSIVHKEVQAVELDLEPEKKMVHYKIYVDSSLIKKIGKYQTLSKATTLFKMWQFKRFLKKEGALDFTQILNKLVQDFCGPQWNCSVEVLDFTVYVEGLGEQSDTAGNQPFNQQPK